MRNRLAILAAFVLINGTVCSFVLAQATSIINSPHDLSALGPGQIHAASKQQVCIFCHTPHNSSPIQPLWNRDVPVSAYTVYSSNSLVARPGQPTGSSKLCLSCHDGTIAVGSVLSQDQPIAMAGGITTIPAGRPSNLGTDLSDDHPISFRYDDDLAARNPKLKSPEALPPQVKLDPNMELQCTTCHDAHDDSKGNFLIMDNSNSQLCNSCHNQGQTDITEHINCNSCHQTHTAPSGPYLLKQKTVTDTCLSCHNGTSGSNQGPNIAADLNKLSKHDTKPDVTVLPTTVTETNCASCHESHTMQNQSAVAPAISPKLGAIDGVDATGAVLPRARYEYEVCFKCHANNNAIQPVISRQIASNNLRLQFSPSAISYHPIEAAGKNSDVPSLVPGMTTASLIYCSDCHNSDTGTTAGGSGANGPHGSNSPPLLIAEYDTTDGTTESANAYALCYRCHQRSSILSNQTFPHSTHVVDQRTPCSVCHDPHGISSAQGTTLANSKLINFDISIVQPLADGTPISYQSTGPRSGTCTLLCHGVEHRNLGYSGGNTVQPAGAQQPAIRMAPALALPGAPTP